MDLGKYIALRVIQLSSSLLSLVASFIMSLMVIRSEKGLSSPHRRIILGLSIADTIHKCALFTGPFLIPKGTEGAYWAAGNQHSCNLNGFFLSIGGTAVPMYFFVLCFYFMYKVRYKTSDKEFRDKIEKKLHAVICIWTLVAAIVLVSTKNINSDGGGGFCYTRPYPELCHDEDDPSSCSRGQHAKPFAMFSFYSPTVACFVGIIIAMCMLYGTVSKQERRNSQYSFRPGSLERSNSRTSEVSSLFQSDVLRTDNSTPSSTIRRHSAMVPGANRFGSQPRAASDTVLPSGYSQRRLSFRGGLSSIDGGDSNASGRPTRRVSFADMRQTLRDTLNRGIQEEENQPPLAAYVSRRERSSRARRYETMKQAMYYVIVFFLSYIWPLSYELAYDNYPFAASIFFYLMYPLGGFFNIVVYTRQKVATLKKRKNSSWPRAFWEVVKAGGDIPSGASTGRRQRRHRSGEVRRRGAKRLRFLNRRGGKTDTRRNNSRHGRHVSGDIRRSSRLSSINSARNLHIRDRVPSPPQRPSHPIALPQDDRKLLDGVGKDICGTHGAGNTFGGNGKSVASQQKRPPNRLPQHILDELAQFDSDSSDNDTELPPPPKALPTYNLICSNEDDEGKPAPPHTLTALDLPEDEDEDDEGKPAPPHTLTALDLPEDYSSSYIQGQIEKIQARRPSAKLSMHNSVKYSKESGLSDSLNTIRSAISAASQDVEESDLCDEKVSCELDIDLLRISCEKESLSESSSISISNSAPNDHLSRTETSNSHNHDIETGTSSLHNLNVNVSPVPVTNCSVHLENQMREEVEGECANIKSDNNTKNVEVQMISSCNDEARVDLEPEPSVQYHDPETEAESEECGIDFIETLDTETMHEVSCTRTNAVIEVESGGNV